MLTTLMLLLMRTKAGNRISLSLLDDLLRLHLNVTEIRSGLILSRATDPDQVWV